MLTDNLNHRRLFALPPIKPSVPSSAAPALRALPEQRTVTGDKELDAMLWLREVVETGQVNNIALALEAAKKISTPAKELEKRYGEYLVRSTGGHLIAGLFSIGFADLEKLAMRSLERVSLAAEASARFDGDFIFENTPAEQFCIQALKRCKGFKHYTQYDKEEVAKRFRKSSELMPQTLSDCLYEIDYWQSLYRLRKAVGKDMGDGLDQAIVREWFVESLLSKIPPRTAEEAEKTLEYAEHSEGIEHDGLIAIARNLLRLHDQEPSQ